MKPHQNSICKIKAVELGIIDLIKPFTIRVPNYKTKIKN